MSYTRGVRIQLRSQYYLRNNLFLLMP
jgi:hypothetical protein